MSASLRDGGVNWRRRGVYARVRRVEVPTAQAPDVEHGHLRVLRRDPHHDGMHHREVEDREQDRDDMEPHAEDERKRGRPLEHRDGRLHPGEEHRSVERGMDHVHRERRRVTGRHGVREVGL